MGSTKEVGEQLPKTQKKSSKMTKSRNLAATRRNKKNTSPYSQNNSNCNIFPIKADTTYIWDNVCIPEWRRFIYDISFGWYE